jgi:prolyl oligopeptidase
VGVTEDGKYLIMVRNFGQKNEVFFKRLESNDPPTPIATGFDGAYGVDIIQDRIIITTDSGAPMQKVYWTTVDKPGKQFWRTLIPENKQDKLEYVSGIDHHLYASYLHNAHTVVRIYDLDGRYIRDLPFPTLGSGYIGGYWSKPDVWVYFSSFAWPPTIYKYDFAQNRLNLFHKFPLNIDVSNFAVEQVWCKSKDSTPISMFLIHRKDLKPDGANPVLLTGYGGFNIPMTPYFSTTYVVFLELGGMVAIPNLRGGGEYGKAWHEAGMLGRKQNVFDDFIAAAEWLITHHYTSPQHLAIIGASNGGLLVGAVTVQRPDLFRTVVCDVPLLDMLRYHKFGYANIWATEYGTADDSTQFQYLYRYSPYHNVHDGVRYPAMLITASDNDARVGTMHARKMTARLQAADAGGGPILFELEKASGHEGGTTISAGIEQAADRYAFILAELGIKTPGRY